MGRPRGMLAIAGLAVLFATFLAMMLVLSGRLHAGGLTLALMLGALGAAVFVAPHPIRAARGASSDARGAAALGGVLAFFAPPACIAAVRMSDAPPGAVVGFWSAGGWAAIAGLAAAWLAWRAGRRGAALLGVAGAGAALAGAAAVLANWERPSSFSPLVRFPAQEAVIFAAGVLLVAGLLLLMRAHRIAGLGPTLVVGSAAGAGAAAVYFLITDPLRSLASVGELPVQVIVAALAWGGVCALLPVVTERSGLGTASGALAVAPVLLSALTGLEVLVGVAGPQPLVAQPVVAGALVLVCAALALSLADAPLSIARGRVALRVGALLPLAAALAALAVPAITATVSVHSSSAVFDGSWTMAGWESVAAWVAVALAGLVAALAAAPGPRLLPFVGLAAALACFMLRDVPTHVLNNWLSAAVQSYYGTEYGFITFSVVTNVPLIVALVATALGFAVLGIIALLRPARPVTQTTEV